MLGGTEILILAGAFVAVFFGGTILRNWGKAAGESIREVRKLKKEFSEPLSDDPRPGPTNAVDYPEGK